MRSAFFGVGLILLLVPPVLALGPFPCEFQSHSLDPLNPATNQPFTLTLTFLASCFEFLPATSSPGLVTVPVDCTCGIATPPGPTLQTFDLELPGLPAGLTTIEIMETFEAPPDVIYSVDVNVGSALEVPATSAGGMVALVVLLLASGLAVLRWRS
jgi:hypothetical protein